MSRRWIKQRGSRSLLLLVSIICVSLLIACSRSTSGEPRYVVEGGDVARGKEALQTYACVTCHTVPGVKGPDTYVGPPLTAWSERDFIVGTLPNEPDSLVKWITDPREVRPDTAMPDMQVSEAVARDIAAYLYTLHK